MNKKPITLERFAYYINIINKEYRDREAFYAVDLGCIFEDSYILDVAVELLADMFHDNEYILEEWVFEQGFGENNNVTQEEIYNILVNKYNSVGGDDISLKEECSQEK